MCTSEFKHIVGRLFVAHEHDADHIHHHSGADDLRIGESGDEDRLIFDKRQNVAHHIAAASRMNLALGSIFTAKDLGVQFFGDLNNLHFRLYSKEETYMYFSRIASISSATRRP